MTTTTAPAVVPLCSSNVEKVFDIPFSTNYRIEATLSNDDIKVFEGVKMYTESVELDKVGNVTIKLNGKSDKDGCVTIGESRYAVPKFIRAFQYFIHGKTLFAVKKHDVKTVSDGDSIGLALNHGLFHFPWERCCVIHRDKDNKDMWAEMTRYEWDHGELSEKNREVQMFAHVPNIRFVPLSLDIRRNCVHPNISDWMDGAMSFLG